MWWQRRPTRADRIAPVGVPPARGAWRQVHSMILGVMLAVAVAIGWAMPLLGISLAGFLFIDILIGAVHRRRRRRATSTSPAPTRT